MAKKRIILYILPKTRSGTLRKYWLLFKLFEISHGLVIKKYFSYRNLNIYEACVPDRMHHIDLGLFKYQLEFTQDVLKKVGGTNLQKIFDDHLRQIPRFPGLKLLR